MRTLAVAALTAVSLLTSSVAFADGPSKSRKVKAKKKMDVVMVASAEPLPQLPAPEPTSLSPSTAPAPSPAPAAPPKDAPATKMTATEPPPAGAGFVLVLGSGGAFLGGQVAEGIDIKAGLMTFDLKLGAYVTSHVGILAGIQGGYGALFEGCAGTCSNAFHYQIPVVAQYAFQDRRRGPYVEGGLAFLTTYGASTDSKAHPEQSPETLEVSTPIDIKLGAGLRVPVGATPGQATSSALDLRLGADLGQFKKIDYRTVDGDVTGDIAAERQAMHFALGLSVGYHFAP